MSINFNDIRTFIYQWAVANVPSNVPVIYLYNNSPRPTVDYVTLYFSGVNQIGWDYVNAPVEDDGIAVQVGDREFTVQIQAYGGDTLSILNNLRTSLQKQSVLDTLRANGIVLANWFGINDVTDLIDSRFEQRASMDVLFRIADIYNDISGVISTVELQEVFLDPSGDIVYDETFLIPPT